MKHKIEPAIITLPGEDEVEWFEKEKTMSHKQNPPRQDRRTIGRSPVRDHAGKPSVGTRKPVINDPKNGRNYDGGSAPAPGACGVPLTGPNGSEW